MKKLRHARSSNRVADYVIDDLNNDEALALVLEAHMDEKIVYHNGTGRELTRH